MIFLILFIELFAQCLGYEAESTEGVYNLNAFCQEELLESSRYGTFLFPKTEAKGQKGNLVRIPCPFGFRNDGFEPILGKSVSATSKAVKSGVLRRCNRRTLTNEDGTTIEYGEWSPSKDNYIIQYCKREGWEETLAFWLARLDTVDPISYSTLGPLMGRLFLYAEEDYECGEALINGIASLLTSPKLNGEEDGVGIGQGEINRLFDIIERYSQSVSSLVREGFKLQVGNAGIIVETAKFYDKGRYSILENAMQPYGTELRLNYSSLSSSNINLMVNISAEALEMSLKQNASINPQLTITGYSHDVFQQWNKNSENQHTFPNTGKCLPSISTQNGSFGCAFSEEGCEEQDPPYKSWGLICIELDGEVKDLKEPVTFFVETNHKVDFEKFKPVCVYWNEIEQNWSTNGLITTQEVNGIKCTSTHLSAFSALIEPLPLPFPDSEYAPINNSIHSFILSILSSVGSVCSIIGLSLTLFTYAIFSSLRRERSNRILINLCCSLLFLHIISLSGSKDLWDGHCFVPATSLHYLVLTSLAWMMVEAVHMYDLLVSVFVRPESKFLLKRFILAWGLPLIIVGVCAAVHPEVYTVGRASLCLMSAHANIYMYYAAYIFPISIILGINMVIFCRVFRVLYKQTKRTHGSATKFQTIKISPLQIKGAMAVLVLLGIGWILGLLAIGPFEVFFRYMYCVVNAGQGLFIFLFRVALNPHACKQWKKVMLGLSQDSSLDVSDTTSSTNTKRNRRKSTATVISPTFISASNSVENSLTSSNSLSKTLATTLASILKSERERPEALETNHG